MSKNSDSNDEAKSYEPDNKDESTEDTKDTSATSAVKYDVVFDDDEDALDLGSLTASGQISADTSSASDDDDEAEDSSENSEAKDSTEKETESGDVKNTDTKDSKTDSKAAKAKSGDKTEKRKKASNDDGKASSDNVATSNAQRVNETLGLAIAEEDELSAHEAESPVIEPATAVSTHLDKETIAEADILLKPNPTFALDHVTFANTRTGRYVLDDIDWGFFAGSLYAVTGADDEQRRVLLGVASGFYRPESGQVMVKSQSLLELETNEIRGHRIGLITQRYSLRKDLDALSNLTFTMRASGRTFLKPIPEAARDVLEYVDFDEAATGVKAADLKPVDQRRLAIARAICCEATVILADDPAGGLDAHDRSTILDLLSRIAHAKDPKRCVIVLVPGFGSDSGEDTSVDTTENIKSASETSAGNATKAKADDGIDAYEYASATDYEAKADKVYSF